MSARPEEDDNEHQAFLPCTIEEARKSRSSSEFSDTYTSSDPTPRPWTIMRRYLRLAMEIGMAITILLLVGRVVYDKKSSHSSPIPDFPKRMYTFTENPKYLNESMFSSQDATIRTLHNWLELSAMGRGYVKIANYKTFDLGEPYTIDVHAHQEPAYMMSVFHQLHCLSYLVQAYQTAFDGAELTHELAHHSTHCFDYLRQSIMCNADTTLEGKTEFGPGWGSRHHCRDYEALLAWANEHSATAWRANMVDTAVL